MSRLVGLLVSTPVTVRMSRPLSCDGAAASDPGSSESASRLAEDPSPPVRSAELPPFFSLRSAFLAASAAFFSSWRRESGAPSVSTEPAAAQRGRGGPQQLPQRRQAAS